MATEEQIKELAHFIWEKEGRPEGRAEHHYSLAKQILEMQERTQKEDIISIKNMWEESNKTARYYFRFNIAIALLAIATVFSYLKPSVIIIAGVKSEIVGAALTLLTIVCIIAATVEYKPYKYHLTRTYIALGIMIVGTVLIPVGFAINQFQWVGWVVFLVGLYMVTFSKSKSSTI